MRQVPRPGVEDTVAASTAARRSSPTARCASIATASTRSQPRPRRGPRRPRPASPTRVPPAMPGPRSCASTAFPRTASRPSSRATTASPSGWGGRRRPAASIATVSTTSAPPPSRSRRSSGQPPRTCGQASCHPDAAENRGTKITGITAAAARGPMLYEGASLGRPHSDRLSHLPRAGARRKRGPRPMKRPDIISRFILPAALAVWVAAMPFRSAAGRRLPGLPCDWPQGQSGLPSPSTARILRVGRRGRDLLRRLPRRPGGVSRLPHAEAR
jgi:hypothetical protein